MRQRILAVLQQAGSPICDDCMVDAARLRSRQQSNQRCRKMAEEGRLRRGHGPCSLCGKHKLTNALQDPGDTSWGAPPPGVGGGGAADLPWYWEGNVQARLASWLEEQGYSVLAQANTRSRQPGPDINAIAGDETKLLVSVKGYPEARDGKRTRPATQARHWFSAAIFDALLYRHSDPEADLAVAFPSIGRTYRALAARMTWLRSTLPLRIYWVAESGEVTSE